MSVLSSPKLLDYYQRELAYLRNAGALFAKDYPKIAHRLDFSSYESSDPHTERLIESFAFLTARLHKDLDDKFPRISQSLLSVLYPQLVEPIPSTGIVQFQADQQASTLTTAYRIPRGTELRTNDPTGESPCYFKTCFDLDLWPISLVAADIVGLADFAIPKQINPQSHQALRLRFHAAGTPFHQLKIRSLRLFVSGEPGTAGRLYDRLMTRPVQVFQKNLRPKKNDLEPEYGFAPFTSIQPAGLAADEALLPYPASSHPGYRLLQEYAVLPEKFMFINLVNIDCRHADKELEFLITLSPARQGQAIDKISPDNIRLGCTPIVNLFNRISEPIRLDYFQDDYRLVADMRRERATEIHSINRVTAIYDNQPDVIDYHPYFSFDHSMQESQATRFWFAQRRASIYPDMAGTDVHLSFVNLEFDPIKPNDETVYAHVSCTNRGLAEHMAPDAELIFEAAAPVKSIRLLGRPTPQKPATLDVDAQWKLVSHLCLNHLSLQDGDIGLNGLKEQLRLYNLSGSQGIEAQLQRLLDLECTPVVRRMGDEAWRGFVRGISVSLTVTDSDPGASSMIVFGHVLAEYLSLFVSINAFVELTFKHSEKGDTWKRWNPKPGEQFLL